MLKPNALTTAMIATTAALVTAPAAANSADVPTTLEVAFVGIERQTGQIMMSVYDNEAAHDGGGKPVRVAAVTVEGGRAVVRFEGLAPGSYAIKAFHDVDGNGEMATNPFGMPLEPFAFSNDAKPEGGPARWHAAHFPVSAGANAVSITIQ